MLHRQRQPSRERFGLRAFLCAAVTVFAFSLLFLVSNLPSPEPSFQSEQKPVAKPRDPETRQTAPIEEIREKPLVKDSSGTRAQVRTQAQAQELPQPHPSDAPLPTIAEIRKNYAAAATSGGEDDPCLIKHLGKSRNYSMFPVIVRIPKRAGYAYEEGCDVPCLYTSAKDFPYLDASVKLIPGGNAIPQDDHPAVCIKHHQKVMMSMESILNYPALKRKSLNAKGYNIQAIYDTNSDVPVPYFSWAEYDIYKKPVPKVNIHPQHLTFVFI